MPAAIFTARIRDFSDEYTTLSVPVDDLETASAWSVVEAMGADLEAALAGAILGTLVEISFRQAAIDNADDRPASGEAQREKGLRLFYHDDVDGRKGNVTIGTADFGALAQPGTDLVPLDHAEVAPIVTWVEQYVNIVPDQTVTVDRAVLVGRNS